MEGDGGKSTGRKTFQNLGRSMKWSKREGSKAGGQKEFFININPMTFTARLRDDTAGCHDRDYAARLGPGDGCREVRLPHPETIRLRRSNQFILVGTGTQVPQPPGLTAYPGFELTRRERRQVEQFQRKIHIAIHEAGRFREDEAR